MMRRMPKHVVPEEQREFAKAQRAQQTRLEARLWHELRAGRLDGWKFKRQVPIEGYVADFVCFEKRLIVEMDGPLHLRPEQRLKDEARDAALADQGFRILRFSDETALGRVVDEIRRALSSSPSPDP
jgi:very-short-patch-repair endonuclease